MRLLLDTNIIVDVALERAPFCNDAITLFEIISDEHFTALYTATTITDIYYLIQKQKGKATALTYIKKILSVYEIANVNKQILLRAANNKFSDFEDAVQYETAESSQIDIIITRNKKDFKHSKIKVLTPKEFIKQYK
jgi:predicted nucleic acid-binding protein